MDAYQGMNELMGSFLGVLISTVKGLILGLEGEYDKLKDQGFAGIRTFPIVAILGFSLGSLTEKITPWLLIVSFRSLYFVSGV
jgi:ABC-type nitrate/sulfonate/bicarbonate transport system permease component